MPDDTLPVLVPRPANCPDCGRPNPVPVDDPQFCPMCDDGRLRIEDLKAADETHEVWRLVVETAGDAWLICLEEGNDDRPDYVLNEKGTLMLDEVGMPFVPDSNRVFHYSIQSPLNDAIEYAAECTHGQQSWTAVHPGLLMRFSEKLRNQVFKYVARRLAAEEDPARIGLLAADDRPMVREAASLALEQLKEAGQLPGQ